MAKTKKSSYSDEDRRYRIERLKEAVDARALLESLGFVIYKETAKEVRAACKVHGGDNKTAFRMNKATKNWVCFSHHCHEEIGYDVISLIMYMLDLNFREAIEYLENITGLNVNDPQLFAKYKDDLDKKKFIQEIFNNQYMPPALVNEEYLDSFKKFRTNFFEKPKNGGFPKEVLDHFEVGGGYVDKFGLQREVIPIRDENGVLVAYSCRDITGQAEDNCKYILTENFKKNDVLYNLYNAKMYMGSGREIIVVEGFKSVWKLFMAGYKNVVACMGSRITEGQQALLYKYVKCVYLLFDADKAGIEGTIDALENMKDKIDVKPIFLPYTGKDPADLSINELKLLLGGIINA